MTNKEKALALIGTFVSGDLELAKSLLALGYKQHNLAFGTGADAFVAAVAGLQQAPVKTYSRDGAEPAEGVSRNHRAFEDVLRRQRTSESGGQLSHSRGDHRCGLSGVGV